MADAIKIRPQQVGAKWRCRSCKSVATVSIYVALHMKDGLIHTCSCGQKSEVEKWKVKPIGEVASHD